jgi:DNA-binding beta-propeller fold protein YncE/cytochrome c
MAETATVRRPVALTVAADGERVLVANRESGSISVLELATKKIVSEQTVARRLADLAWNGDHGPALAVDDSKHELLVLQAVGGQVEVVGRLPVPGYPVSVRLRRDASKAYVTSLWSRRLTSVDLSVVEQPRVEYVIDLPFAPREQCLSTDERILYVADAFGGQIAVVDLTTGSLMGIRQITGHHLRGLTVDHERPNLLVAHQILHADEETTEGGVHWGGVMSNVLRAIPLSWLESGAGKWDEGLYYLGQPQRATGDPGDLVATKGRRRIIAYSGLGELGVSDVGANVYDHVAVGRRPLALALSPDEQTVLVANSLEDSVSIVKLSTPPLVETVSLGPVPELTAAQRGELLFYDAKLASDGWFSCHSCHTDGHSNGGKSDTLGDASFGAPKRVLSLLGVRDTAPWAWNGGMTRLDEQVRKSLESTMRGPKPTDQQIQDLTAYLQTLQPPPSMVAARHGDRLARENPGLAAAIGRGRKLFETGNCSSCHVPDAYTSEGAYDVKLVDERGKREFNPPSLRGVSQRDRLFHDNRSRELAEVFARYHHGLDEPLSDRQIGDLVAFLNSL